MDKEKEKDKDKEPIRISLSGGSMTIAIVHQLIAQLAIGYEVTLTDAALQDPASAVGEFIGRLTRHVHLHAEDKQWLQEAVRLEVRQALDERVKRGRL